MAEGVEECVGRLGCEGEGEGPEGLGLLPA